MANVASLDIDVLRSCGVLFHVEAALRPAFAVVPAEEM
jgi:hypothetical protein